MSTKLISRIKSPFAGTGVALITPFCADGSIDFPGLTKVIQHIIKGKCEYIVVMGTTAESPSLSKQEKSTCACTCNNKWPCSCCLRHWWL